MQHFAHARHHSHAAFTYRSAGTNQQFMAKYQQVASKLESIKTELPNHSSVDTSLKYFKFANIFSEYLHYSQEEAMSLSRELQSWDTLTDHYGQPITDRYENHTTTTIHVINTPQQM